MIDVAILSVIRRWHLREGISIREIVRRTGLSRNTIREYLANGMVEPKYQSRKSPSQLDEFATKLAQWLLSESQKGRKQRRSMLQMAADLRALGYRGSYDRVAAFARDWRAREQARTQSAARGTFVPLIFASGDAFQFDWSEDWAVIAGERTKLQVAQFKLSHSRAFILRAYLLQTHEMLFDAHNHAFRVFGGVAARGIYDNMKSAVDKVKKGKQREVNAKFMAMVSHYLYAAEFCNVAAGWEKGQIEKNVQDSRRRVWQDVPECANLLALNDWLEARCLALWQTIRHPEQPDRTVAQMWADEQAFLMPMPQPYDGFVETSKRVSSICLIHVERNRYSVPASFAHRRVSVHLYADHLKVIAEGQVIAKHDRIIQRRNDQPGRTIYDWRHYLSVLQRKPGALRNGAPFTQLPEAFKRLQTVLLKHPGGEREMVEILALVLHHDEQAVLTAVELALESGVPSKQHVLNVLGRLIEPAPPAPIETPATLALTREPQANVDRYDQLREIRDAA